MALTILLADDSMTAQNMGKKILTEAGYEVVAVSNGAAAVKKIAEHRPDLAVLDVYMPGYTGLEVCERLKSAHETNAMPVLLTVGKMEPFKAEEGSRVKADGLIIKPFEATDLLAAIQKLEEKLNLKGTVVATPADPDEVPEYERTVKIAAPVFDDADESYKAWKAETPDHGEGRQRAAPGPQVPSELQAAPAFAEELNAPAGERRVTKDFTAPTEELAPQEILHAQEPELPGGVKGLLSKAKGWFGGAEMLEETAAAESPAPEVEETVRLEPPAPAAEPGVPAAAVETMAMGSAAEPMGHFENVMPRRTTEPLEQPALAPEFETLPAGSLSAPASEPEPAGVAPVEFHAGPLPEAEPVPAQAGESAITPAPGFEPTAAPQAEERFTSPAQDPALVTDASEIATAFPTKFGIEGAEPVHVGIASEFPGLYGNAPAAPSEAATAPPEAAEAPAVPKVVSDAEFDRRVAEAMETGWTAEPAALEAHEHGVALHEEMRQHYAQSAAGPEKAAAAAPEPAAAAPAAGENAPDHELAAAMAAAVGEPVEPAASGAATEESAPGETTLPLDQHTAMVADVVHRVTERLKPELVAEIARELAEEMRRKRGG